MNENTHWWVYAEKRIYDVDIDGEGHFLYPAWISSPEAVHQKYRLSKSLFFDFLCVLVGWK